MANPSKQRGTLIESRVRAYLLANGWPDCDRQPLRGSRDQGDLIVCRAPVIIAECKARKGTISERTIADWMEQTETEAVHAGAVSAVLIVARHGIRVGEYDAIMRANDWALLLTEDSLMVRDAPWPMRASLADWSAMAKAWADS
jgi:hypothetical protein